MKQATFSSPDDASRYLSEHIITAINTARPSADRPYVLGLPTGLSPEGVYACLVAAFKAGRVLFQHVVTFNMDEYVGLAPLHPQSYHYFMFDRLFNHIDIPRKNINILDGQAQNIEQECARYEQKIKLVGGIDLFLGGLGPNGHLAFNEAGLSRKSLTRKVSLAQSTIVANKRFFNDDDSLVPRYALSVGISTVLDNSREIAVIVLGRAKKTALQKTLYGPANDPQCPSLYLQGHSNVLIVCDNAAAGLEARL